MAVSRSGSAFMPENCWNGGADAMRESARHFTRRTANSENDAGDHSLTKSSDRILRQEKKIIYLEWELNDLRQGLAVVKDYYRDLELFSEDRDVTIHLEQVMVRPLLDDEREFNEIWTFHEKFIISDPSGHTPYAEMYDAFMQYCRKKGNTPVEQEMFEFAFARMENPSPVSDRGEWKGCRLLTGRE